MLRYGLTILLSAFLLFMIQPLVARKLLPELGGTATIWTTCMMFFQVALFVGYLYAHGLRVMFSPATAWRIHCCGIGIAVWWLLGQPFGYHETEARELSWAVTHRLFSMIGIPFIVLAATSSLVQAWHSVSHPHQRTYRLYALSNLGSLIALVSYPFVFDPLVGVSMQSQIWNSVFLGYAVMIVVSGFGIGGEANWPDKSERPTDLEQRRPFSWYKFCAWVGLAATGSLLLIATSNVLCQEVASFPFLWLLPLIFYLLTLIVCFDWPGIYRRWFFQPAFALSCYVAIIIYHFGTNVGLLGQSIGCCAALFFGCMICHGELYRLRPQVGRLTTFYLAIAFGGAIGGVFAVVVAPRVFNRFFEFHVGLLLIVLLSTGLYGLEYFRKADVAGNTRARSLNSFLLISGMAAVPVVCSVYYYLDPALNRGILFQGRNDYGLVSVKETEQFRIMNSGSTNHGGQFLVEDQRHEPFAYYSDGSGAQQAFEIIRNRRPGSKKSIKVGVVGLGTGSLLNHGREGDQFRFYEINPMVERVAMEYFQYLPAKNAEIILGDGRVELERELENSGSNQFDLLFLDAFSSDSIPVHLLTMECFDLYLEHLNSNGMIIAHITNKFVDLKPVLASVAQSKGLVSVNIEHRNDEFMLVTDWVLLSPDRRTFDDNAFELPQFEWAEGLRKVVWTDDNSSVLPVVNWYNNSRTGNIQR